MIVGGAVGVSVYVPRDVDIDIASEVAVEAALDQFREAEKPPGKQCSNCRGTGKVGDTRVMYECPVCGGDGVL